MKNSILIAVAIVIGSLTQNASASLTYTFGDEFSGSGSALSGDVVVTIANVDADTVSITIDTFGLDASLSEYISALYLNLDPSIDPTTLDVDDPGAATSIDFGADAFQADGDGLYDILVAYPSAAADRFEADMTDTIVLSRLGGLSYDDFDFQSAPAGGKGPFSAALRARSLDEDGEGSGWFAPQGEIPEPGALAIWGGLLGLAAFHKRRRRRS